MREGLVGQNENSTSIITNTKNKASLYLIVVLFILLSFTIIKIILIEKQIKEVYIKEINENRQVMIIKIIISHY